MLVKVLREGAEQAQQEIPMYSPFILRPHFAYIRCDSHHLSNYNSLALTVGPIAIMCQVKNPAVDRIITDKNPSSVVPLPKRRLNPAALEFVSSRSESEASSVADEADYNEQGQVENHTEEVSPSKRGPKVRIMGPGGNYTEHHGENINDHSRFRSHPNYGWESPQVR